MKDLDLALSITGKFEGHDLFGNISGNFDGMGVSAGVLQWNFGMGSLQTRILAKYMEKHGDLDMYFPEPIAHLVKAGSNEDDVRWVERHMLQPGSTKLRPEWTKAWRKFMTLPEVVALQKTACNGVSNQAEKIQKDLKLTSVKSYCWAFDIVTQNGSLKGLPLEKADRTRARELIDSSATLPVNQKIWGSMLSKVDDEAISLFTLSFDRAKIANPRWFHDVFSRKGTIALGKGYVHEQLWDFTLAFDQKYAEQAPPVMHS